MVNDTDFSIRFRADTKEAQERRGLVKTGQNCLLISGSQVRVLVRPPNVLKQVATKRNGDRRMCEELAG